MSRVLSPKLRESRPGVLLHWCPGCHARHPVRVAGPEPGPQWGWNQDVAQPEFSPSLCHHSSRLQNPKDPTSPRVPLVLCHYFIRRGYAPAGEDPALAYISFCGDSPHSLAGQTVLLPDFPD
jgi:hypothetical protein